MSDVTTKTPLGTLAILVASLSIPFFLMGRQLTLPLWYDEAYTLGRYASRPVADIVSDYSEPNNHIGYTLLMHPLAEIRDHPGLHRMPSFLMSLTLLVCVFRLGYRTFGPLAATCSALLLGTNQVFLNYSAQVRGYSMSMLLTMIVVQAAQADTRSTWLSKRTLVIVPGGGYLIYVIPTNLLFLSSIGAAAVGIRWWHSGRRQACIEASIFLAAVVFAGLLYFPVLDQIRETAAASSFSLRALMNVARSFSMSICQDPPFILALLTCIPLTVMLYSRAVVPDIHQKRLLILLATVIPAPFLQAAVLRIAPFERNFLPALPLVALLAGLSFSVIVKSLSQISRSCRRIVHIICAALMVGQLSLNLTFANRLSDHRANGRAETPYYLYTAANYDPAAVIHRVSQSVRVRACFACVMSDRAWQNLGYRFSVASCPVVASRVHNGEPTIDTIYVITMAPPNYEELGRTSGFAPDVLNSASGEMIGGFIVSTIETTAQLPRQLREEGR